MRATLLRRLHTDGPLAPEYRRPDLVDTLHHEVWGQGFAPPVFSEEVEIISQRLVADKHLQIKLKHQGQPVDAIWFGHTEPLPARVKLAFRLDADEWQGVRRVRFLVEARGSRCHWSLPASRSSSRCAQVSPTGTGARASSKYPNSLAATTRNSGSSSVCARASCHIAYSRSPSIMAVLMQRPWPAMSRLKAASNCVGQ